VSAALQMPEAHVPSSSQYAFCINAPGSMHTRAPDQLWTSTSGAQI